MYVGWSLVNAKGNSDEQARGVRRMSSLRCMMHDLSLFPAIESVVRKASFQWKCNKGLRKKKLFDSIWHVTTWKAKTCLPMYCLQTVCQYIHLLQKLCLLKWQSEMWNNLKKKDELLFWLYRKNKSTFHICVAYGSIFVKKIQVFLKVYLG